MTGNRRLRRLVMWTNMVARNARPFLSPGRIFQCRSQQFFVKFWPRSE
jgi:hypothetical protein